jgi:hypothetical protein
MSRYAVYFINCPDRELGSCVLVAGGSYTSRVLEFSRQVVCLKRRLIAVLNYIFSARLCVAVWAVQFERRGADDRARSVELRV